MTSTVAVTRLIRRIAFKGAGSLPAVGREDLVVRLFAARGVTTAHLFLNCVRAGDPTPLLPQ